MACDELSKACEKVGRFFRDFALVEHEIDKGIAAILKLNSFAADVLADSMPFHKKANLFGTIALDMTPAAEKKGITALFNDIIKRNTDRNMMAHSRFEPAQSRPAKEEAVQFWRTTARDRKVKVYDPVWDKEKFEQESKKLREIKDKLAEITPTIILKVSEDGTMEWVERYYLSEPSVTWVPTPLPGQD